MSVFGDTLARLGAKMVVFIVVAVVAIAALTYFWAKSERDKEALREMANQRLADSAKDLGFAQGEKLKSDEKAKIADKKLAAAYAALKKKGGTLDSHSDTTVEVSDTIPGHTLPEAATAPATWVDEHHRFTLRLPSGPLERRQVFGIEGIVVRSADGSIKATDYNFKEYDPATKEEIPTEGAKVETKFQFIEEKAQGPGPWRVRLVGGVDHRLAPGAGVAINPWRGLSFGLIGFYSPKEKEGRGAFFAGWRLLNSTISLGPSVGVSSKGGGIKVGAAGVIELTR